MKRLISILIVLFVINIVLGQNKFSEENICVNQSLENVLATASKQFALNLFLQMVKKEKDRNIFISPLSILFALTMTYNGAEGLTKKEMEYTLFARDSSRECHVDSGKEEINKYFSNLINKVVQADSQLILNIANSLWARKDIKFKEDFLKMNKEFFKSEINSLDFTSPQAVDTINKWVKNNTNNKIRKIVDNISANAILYLINAIYFKGTWKYKFSEKQTKEEDFYLLDGKTKKVEFMRRDKGEFNYYEDDSLQIVELPYARGNISMFIFLPAKDSSLEEFYHKLNRANLDEWLSKLYPAEVSLSIPKFELEYEKRLNDVLEESGIKRAFDPRQADFSGMVDKETMQEGGIWIEEVKHKTFIEVNEEGTEAGAITSVNMATAERYVKARVFRANRPFFFLIKENKTDTVIFAGSIIDP